MSDIVDLVGGAEKVLCNMANELTLRGHQVTVVCNDIKQGLPFYPLMKEVNFINLDGSGCKKRYSRIKKIVREATRPLRKTALYPLFPDPVEHQKVREFNPLFRRVISSVKPDIIISHCLFDHCLVVKTIGHDHPLMLMHHSNPHFMLLGASFDILHSLRRCDCLQLLLPGYEKEVRKALPWVKTQVIPNTVPIVEDRYLAKQGGNKDKYVIAMIANLKQIKQQHLLIQAFAHLAKEYPQWKVHFYGSGNDLRYKNYLEALICKHDLQNQVFLMGTTDKPLDMLRESDIFAFPTAFEGFPLALTEAMAVGLPCIGLKTALGVNELIIDGYNGLLSDNNEFDFAQKLKQLMDNPQLRATMGRNGHEFVKQFEPKKIWDQWENLIIETVQQFRQHKAA